MDDLLKLLIELESSKDPNLLLQDFLCQEFLPLNIPPAGEISRRAEELLITSKGECDWERIEYLKSNGYDVFPVEKDGFGWLIGGIQTKRGVITYG